MKKLLFTPENMEKAVAGRKTQTRRIIRNIPPEIDVINTSFETGFWFAGTREDSNSYQVAKIIAPEHKVRDIVIGATTWAVHKDSDGIRPSDLGIFAIGTQLWHAGMKDTKPWWTGKNRPGRFLPKHLYGYMPQFRITAVRAERLQDISEEDAVTEGVDAYECLDCDALIFIHQQGDTHYYNSRHQEVEPVELFRNLWDSINASRGHGWDVNDWVWVYEFERVK